MDEIAHLLARCEFKLASNGDAAMTLGGYGAVFGNVDAYGDVIEQGAFSAWLADVNAGRQSWPSMLSQHGGFGISADDLTPVGVWTGIEEDSKGLKVDGKFADTPRGRELYALMKMAPRPAIDGLSIGYIAREWESGAKAGEPRRRLKRIDVLEISPVTFPANGKARVTAVKGERPASIRAFEGMLRDVCGFSAREAKRLASGGWPAFTRDVDEVEELSQVAELLRATANDFTSRKETA